MIAEKPTHLIVPIQKIVLIVQILNDIGKAEKGLVKKVIGNAIGPLQDLVLALVLELGLGLVQKPAPPQDLAIVITVEAVVTTVNVALPIVDETVIEIETEIEIEIETHSHILRSENNVRIDIKKIREILKNTESTETIRSHFLGI